MTKIEIDSFSSNSRQQQRVIMKDVQSKIDTHAPDAVWFAVDSSTLNHAQRGRVVSSLSKLADDQINKKRNVIVDATPGLLKSIAASSLFLKIVVVTAVLFALLSGVVLQDISGNSVITFATNVTIGENEVPSTASVDFHQSWTQSPWQADAIQDVFEQAANPGKQAVFPSDLKPKKKRKANKAFTVPDDDNFIGEHADESLLQEIYRPPIEHVWADLGDDTSCSDLGPEAYTVFSDDDSHCDDDFQDCIDVEEQVFDQSWYTWACSAQGHGQAAVWNIYNACKALAKHAGRLDVVQLFGGGHDHVAQACIQRHLNSGINWDLQFKFDMTNKQTQNEFFRYQH